LRVLRGVGGEREFLRRYTAQSQEVRRAGVGVAGIQATLDALQVLLPGAFVVGVTWLGARFAIDGRIGPGDLVAFYGYAIFLVLPLRTATEMLEKFITARVAAERVVAVLRVRPAVTDPRLPVAPPPPLPDLDDPLSGLHVPAGGFVALVGVDPDDGARVADRLGRLVADVEGASPLLGGVAVSALPVAEVRRRVVVADSDPRLFTGGLRRELDPGRGHDEADLMAAVTTAAAHDVLETLPRGLDDEVAERGRSFSGGQRQRLALVRALLTDAETLVLVEPTSAVDAHTEAAIAANLRDARSGRTTIVVTSSPLLLDRVDEVALLVGGRVVAQAPHRDLLGRDDQIGATYRATVTRGEDE
ncbi:MAG TPA: ABC transporter ATP-binding protein, partial [Actinomycetales bacterium]|nr:ABC transporter ATP-binding protein [Actinomycetales bacterium]